MKLKYFWKVLFVSDFPGAESRFFVVARSFDEAVKRAAVVIKRKDAEEIVGVERCEVVE
jgi:hypothetical protein